MTVFGQEDLNRLLWDSQYLIHLHGGEQGEKDYVTKFWDLKSGERYTAYETVRRYDKLQRDLETITLEDMERGMNQVQEPANVWLSPPGLSD